MANFLFVKFVSLYKMECTIFHMYLFTLRNILCQYDWSVTFYLKYLLDEAVHCFLWVWEVEDIGEVFQRPQFIEQQGIKHD